MELCPKCGSEFLWYSPSYRNHGCTACRWKQSGKNNNPKVVILDDINGLVNFVIEGVNSERYKSRFNG